MGTTPLRRLVPVLTTALAAALASGAVCAPAQARTPSPGGPVTGSLRSPTTVVTPPGAATTVIGGGRTSWATPVSRFWRTPPGDPAATEVVRLVNVERAKVGCAAVRVDARLTTAARLHSQDMATQNYFSHTSLDGRTPWDRIRAQGYDYGSAENIAAGYATPAAVMTGWMNSAGHKANILNCANKALGVGIGRGGSYGTYWTQDFGGR